MGSPSAEVELLTIDGIATRSEGIRTICKTPEIPEGNILVECDFEVFGHVQGVGFTKDTRDIALNNNVKGWVKNSKRGTIVGKIQGMKDDVDKLVDWMSNMGSPGSKIEKAEFSNWRESKSLTFHDFQIRF